ncbi:D-alanyl-D-alanine carboxypeptidase/D-alanyl-D-alanine-endopeptidase [Amorphoplanes nipponensis]|uniref:D-alanyl-D-alanine carboxypeptidase/D-alanyl-D-alanine-endopeptidase n=1 Tax=Actinoplanes nipponensis TaxID=135950 RepID=A0A919MTT3_9ACTN|nr:D-alanyl-D-alanine carboxypeptidase/D-alanyl-D-alanine-endopeptidase [Actinoplanes nipponensis]
MNIAHPAPQAAQTSPAPQAPPPPGPVAADPPAQPGGPVPGPVIPPEGVAAAAQPGTGRSRRTVVLSVVAALVLVLVAAAGVLVVRPGPVDGWLAGGPAPTPAPSATPDPTPTPVLAAADASAAAPTAAGVRAAIAPLLKAGPLGPRVNVSVADVATGESLFEQNADTMTTPASTTKLLTAATVLSARGPAYRLATRAVAGARPGEVVLVGGGDPTLSVGAKGQFPGAARLDKLAAQVKAALGGQAPTKVLIDTSLYRGPLTAVGWDGDVIGGGQVAKIQPLMTNAGRIQPVHNEFGGDPRFADPALAAGRAFAKQLGLAPGAVSTGTAPAAADPATPSAAASAAPGVAPAPGAELGRVESPPLVHVVDWMLEQSDNVIAEALARQVALAADAEPSFTGAAEAMRAELGELGLPADEVNLYDASGLSRKNGISPKLLTDLLTLAAGGKQPQLSAMFGGLPVAGWSGTLRTRFVTPAPNRIGQGLVRAKTGTLTGVNTISGQLVTEGGRLLVFAIMADATGESVAARQALDKIAAKLVTCGCS